MTGVEAASFPWAGLLTGESTTLEMATHKIDFEKSNMIYEASWSLNF